jgi:hypothetical protein
MFRRDYILRMVEKFAQMLAQIQNRIAERQYGEAQAVLDQAFRELVGTGPEAVSQLSETELLAQLMLGEPTQVLREKSLILIGLLEEAGRLHAVAQRDAESQVCWRKALDLLLTLQLQDTDFELPGFVPRIEKFRERLREVTLPLRTQAALWRHYERIGAYAQAEDMLFSLLEAEPGNVALRSEAKLFYERLLRQSDAALTSGNLPRAEVEAGFAEVCALSK